MKKNSYIECGKIINTHGCHGGVKLESWCNTPEVLASLKSLYLLSGGNYTGHRVLRASVFRQFVVAELEGIADMDAALALKNTIVYARRSDIPLDEGEYFGSDRASGTGRKHRKAVRNAERDDQPGGVRYLRSGHAGRGPHDPGGAGVHTEYRPGYRNSRFSHRGDAGLTEEL